MNKKDQLYKILAILLAIAIISIIVFVIIPKYSRKVPERTMGKIDFSDSSWIEIFMEDQVGIFEKDFFLSSAFSYNPRSNRMIVTYATQKSIAEIRDHYLTLAGAVETGRNDETSLNITARANDQDLRIYNYYSPISRVIELELILDPTQAMQVIDQLEEAIPTSELTGISEIHPMMAGEVFGGYVRYRYDELDEYAYPFTPIFSRAYLYPGSGEDFESALAELNKTYPDYKYDQTQDTYYYKIEEQIISVSYFETDLGENIVSIGIQAADNE